MSINNRVNKLLIYFVIISIGIACHKIEGKGGTSSIEGYVVTQKYSISETEITELIVTNGDLVEHGDYWLINTPDTDEYYYVWYKNNSWITDGNPSLNGRIGIEVTYNYSDSNTEITAKTMTAILSHSSAFKIEMLNDILLIENLQKGEVPDANELSSPFEVNIKSQGKDRKLSDLESAIDEKIYITYGENSIYNDVVRTGPDGKFQFNYLMNGDYKIHVNSLDTITNSQTSLEIEVNIIESKSIIDLDSIHIMQ